MTAYLDRPDNYTLLHRGRLIFFFFRDNCLHLGRLSVYFAYREAGPTENASLGDIRTLLDVMMLSSFSVFGYATKPTNYAIGTILANSRYQ
jgi:hypothetical protein